MPVMNKVTNEFLRKAVIIINRLLSLLYLSVAVFVTYRAAFGEANWIGSIAVSILFCFQAVGHYQPYWWGPKVTAAIFGAVNVGMAIYLLPAYEQDLVPELHERALTFILFTMVTALFVANYIVCTYVFDKDRMAWR